MLKFYVLVSRSLEKVKRHLKVIPNDKIIYVINTLDKKFEKECSDLLKEKDIEYYITESNGTPARGKNELLRIFESSENKYCVQIDGDDYLTPYGVWLYETLAACPHPPDAVCLTDQIAVRVDKKASDKEGKIVTQKVPLFSIQEQDYSIYKETLTKEGFTEEKVEDTVSTIKQFYENAYKYVQPTDSHCRVVFFSKKAAAIKFPEHLLIGEDTLQFFLLKHEAFKGNLSLIVNPEKPTTYVYDQTDGQGTVYKKLVERDWTWMKDFNAEVEKYKSKRLLHEDSLPRLTLRYSKNAYIDDFGFAGLATYKYNENVQILAPANCCKNTLEDLYKGNITIAMKNSS